MQVDDPGDINLTISQEDTFGNGLDVDFICWGPFATLAGACGQLDAASIVDCSFSTADIENCDIPGANTGEFYLLLITNFSDDPGTIDFQQTGGIGTTDCDILDPCTADAGPDVEFCPGGSSVIGGAPTGSGGSSIFTYSWAPTAGLDDPFSPNPTASPTTTTNYTVTVDGGAGCVVQDDVLVTVFPLPVIDIAPPPAFDCQNSTINLDASASDPNSLYTWTTDDGNFLSGTTNPIETINQPGTYVLQLTSDEGCINTDSVAVGVTGNTDVFVTLIGPDSICATTLATMTIVFDQPGVYDLVISVNGFPEPPVQVFGNVYEFTTDIEGTYAIESVDNPFCNATLFGTVDLDVEPLPSLIFPIDPVNLCPGETESAEIIIEGEGDLTVEYSAGVALSNLTTTAGTQTIDVIDAGGYFPLSISTANCTGLVEGGFIVTDVPEPTITFTQDETICDGETADLELNLTGNGPYSFEYALDGVVIGTETSFDDIFSLDVTDAGTYSITSLSDQFCVGSGTNSALLTVNPIPTASISGGGTYCSNEDVPLQVDFVGQPPYTLNYSLNGAPQGPVDVPTDIYTFQTSIEGDYQITGVTDALCPQGLQNSTSIEHFPPIQVFIDAPTAVCEGDSVPFDVVATGGDGNGFTFAWTDSLGFNSALEDLFLPTPTPDDLVLYLTVNDGCGLANEDNMVQVDVQAFPEPAFILSEDSICPGEVIVFERTSDDASIDCQWIFSSAFPLNGCGIVEQTFLSPGPQSVTLTSQTSAGCESSLTVDTAFYVVPDPAAEFSYQGAEGTIFSPQVDFINTSSDAVTYLWEFGDGEFSSEKDTSHIYPGYVSQDYIACLYAFNALGCVDTACTIINIAPEFLVSIPNAFSPDDDGTNDFWTPVFNDIELAEYELIVFNRWGEIVFESYSQGERWNGGAENDAEYYGTDAIYFYKLTVREQNITEKREFFGNVTVLR
jgi:gliding motility-associated-like protein